MKLFTFFRSSAAFRVRIALHIKGLSYEAVPKVFAKNEHRAADYLALNPQGLLPAEPVARANVRSTAQRYCFGDSVSLADVCLVPQVYNARRFNVDLTSFPKLAAISSHLESLPAFARARPEVQPDAV